MTKEQLQRSARHPQQKKISFDGKVLKTNQKIDLHLLWGRVQQVPPDQYKDIEPSINCIKLEIVPIKNIEEFNLMFQKTWLPVMTQVYRCINEIKNKGFPLNSVHWNLFVLYNSNEIGPQQIFLTKLLQTCAFYPKRDPLTIAQEYFAHLYNSDKAVYCTKDENGTNYKSPVFPNVLYLNGLNTQIKPQYSDILKSLNFDPTEIDGFLPWGV